jgi:hypothetical protein
MNKRYHSAGMAVGASALMMVFIKIVLAALALFFLPAIR